MYNLIIALLAISLFSSALWVGVDYLNYEKHDQKITKSKIITDFQTYELAINTYKKAKNIYPSNSNWENDMKSLKLMLPKKFRRVV
ncbi:hypothetical protein VSPL_32400 [Vibrio splendidus]|nr:hypothetical protein VSPL_32400 [Vibrio splendidus]